MDNETPSFTVAPADQGELDAYEILLSHPRAEDFMDALQRQPDGSWVVTISCCGQTYTFRDAGPGALRRLAIDYLTFDVKREERRRAEKLAAEAAKQTAERAVQAQRELLRRSLLGGTS